MSNPVYLALDVPQLEAAKAVAGGKVRSHIRRANLGRGVLPTPMTIANSVHEIAHLGLPIFLDLKFHDIPNTLAAADAGDPRP